MEFPVYINITLLILSPWPIFYAFIFYYGYKFNTNFEYYITKNKQLYKFWAVILFLPIMFSFIFTLRYRRIGLSIDLSEIKENFLTLISPLGYIDSALLLAFLGLFLVAWILSLRLLYQYFRKCLLALYLYYYQYKKFGDYCHEIVMLHCYYNQYLWARVKIFTSNRMIIRITWCIWPFSVNILERNFFHGILPYLLIYDFIIQQAVISKIFIILPWYYIYSLIRFALKFFFQIHTLKNWNISEEMYGDPK